MSTINVRGFDVRFVLMTHGDFPILYINAAGDSDPYVKIVFYDDPTITVYYDQFDALTARELINALELAVEFAHNGPDWRPAEDASPDADVVWGRE